MESSTGASMGSPMRSPTAATAAAPGDAATGPLWAAQAWVGGRWQAAVLLQAGADGNWAQVQTGAACPPGALVLDGPVLPGLVNAHSHAFQRAFAGLAERRNVNQDDFWSWRDHMYRVALRVTPAQQHAIAAQLYLELLRGGFTHTCEFHYLHNAPDGNPYGEGALTMAQAVADAARQVGMGLTLLPTVYERAGFSQPTLREDQRRFRADARAVLATRDALRAHAAATPGGPGLHVGLALHSLRAASPESVQALLAGSDDAPIHIHVAEQTQEVDDCLEATGLRPIEWLCRHAPPDRRWQLVHATHTTPGEIECLARSGAGVVLCPSTEANLGDGITDLPGWLRHGVPISLGSDSNATRSAPEELRLLEYSQRLARRVRCVAAAPQENEPATAARLWSRTLAGGAAAAGFGRWGLEAGARADLLVVDTAAPALLGIPGSYTLDALVFSSPNRPFRDVLVAGRWITRDHRSPRAASIAQRFKAAMQELWERVENGSEQ
jgi:formimidoylglutamate deiminase